jgi:hypothetical protein
VHHRRNINLILGNATVVVSNQKSLSYIVNNGQTAFWVSGYNIMQSPIAKYWNPTLFTTTTASFSHQISALSVTNNTVYWAIGNVIFSKVMGSSANSIVTTQIGLITGVAYDETDRILTFVNQTNGVNFFVYGT